MPLSCSSAGECVPTLKNPACLFHVDAKVAERCRHCCHQVSSAAALNGHHGALVIALIVYQNRAFSAHAASQLRHLAELQLAMNRPPIACASVVPGQASGATVERKCVYLDKMGTSAGHSHQDGWPE